MSANSPEALHRVWADLFNAGDLDGLMALYDPAVLMVPEPGRTITGKAAIREALTGFLSLKGRFTLQFQQALEVGDVALVFSRWNLDADSPQGPIALSGQTSDVARRQTDGRWLMVIDNPFGGPGIDAAQRT
jgi:uncharacterized protein (TIGR02246 family)